MTEISFYWCIVSNRYRYVFPHLQWNIFSGIWQGIKNLKIVIKSVTTKIEGDGNSSFEDISDISGEMDHLNPLAPSVYRPKRRRSTAITERFGVFLSPWGKIISDP